LFFSFYQLIIRISDFNCCLIQPFILKEKSGNEYTNFNLFPDAEKSYFLKVL